MELFEELNHLLVEMSAEKHERLKRHNEIHLKIKELASLLDKSPLHIKTNTTLIKKGKYIPSLEEINVLENYLNELNYEFEMKKQELGHLRSSILDILTKLGKNIDSTKYNSIINPLQETFSDNYINTIQKLHNEVLNLKYFNKNKKVIRRK